MKMLRDEYGGHVPDDFNALLKLPGVGRKSANLIMGMCLENRRSSRIRTGIRLVNRIGLVEGIKDPKRVEMALWKLIPPEEGAISATAWCITGAKSVQRGRNRTVINAVCRISAAKAGVK